MNSETKEEMIKRLEHIRTTSINKFDKATETQKVLRRKCLEDFIKATEELYTLRKPSIGERSKLWFMKKLYKKGVRMNKW